MRRVDVLIGGVLAVALVASALGVLTYEDARGVQTFRVVWSTRELAIGGQDATLSGTGEQEWTEQLTQRNMTSVAFDLTVSGGAPRLQPLAARVEVAPPEGEPQSTEFTIEPSPTGAAETVRLAFPLAPVPDDATVQARSSAEALGRARGDAATDAGVGAWRVLVSLAPSGPVATPGTYDVSYDILATILEGDARPELPRVGR